ncbi:MAG: hypothetical protein WD065_10955 [Planctomycetaceae bacterium]
MAIINPVPEPKGNLNLGPPPKLKICAEVDTSGMSDPNGSPAGAVKVKAIPGTTTSIPTSPMPGAVSLPNVPGTDLWKNSQYEIEQPQATMRFVAWILNSTAATEAFQIESLLIKPDFGAGTTDCP